MFCKGQENVVWSGGPVDVSWKHGSPPTGNVVRSLLLPPDKRLLKSKNCLKSSLSFSPMVFCVSTVVFLNSLAPAAVCVSTGRQPDFFTAHATETVGVTEIVLQGGGCVLGGGDSEGIQVRGGANVAKGEGIMFRGDDGFFGGGVWILGW